MNDPRFQTEERPPSHAAGFLQAPLWQRLNWVAALLFTAFAIALHVFFVLNAGGFWRDEVNTINVAHRHSLGEMANDSFPVLMPLLVRGWSTLGLGATETGLRALGGVIGFGLLSALWLGAWKLKRSPPTLSLALIGLNTTVLLYGDSIRSFGLGSWLLVLVTVTMVWLLQSPSWKRTMLLAATAILSVQALFQNAILLAAICCAGWLVCWLKRDRTAALMILLAALVAAASLVPYWSRILPMAELSPTSGISTLRTQFHPGAAFSTLATAAGFPLAAYVWLWAILALGLLILTVWTWRVQPSAPGNPGATMFPAVALLLGCVGFGAFLWWAALRTQPWYFLPLLAFTAICLDLGLPQFSKKLNAVLLIFAFLTLLISIPVAWRAVHWRFTNVDELAQRLNAEAAAGDFILVTPWNRGISFARYYHGHAPWETVPPIADHSCHRYDLLQHQTLATNVMSPVLERLAASLQSGHHVWIVGTMDIPDAPGSLPPDLEPPPRKYTGWSAGPYVRCWTSQAAQFLKNHSREFKQVPLSQNQSVNPNESLDLTMAQGWETSDTGSPHR